MQNVEPVDKVMSRLYDWLIKPMAAEIADLEYLDSRVLPDLEIPPDLTLTNVDSDFKLPEIFSGSEYYLL